MISTTLTASDLARTPRRQVPFILRKTFDGLPRVHRAVLLLMEQDGEVVIETPADTLSQPQTAAQGGRTPRHEGQCFPPRLKKELP